MLVQIRIWVALIGLILSTATAQAQAALPALPAAPSTPVVAATTGSAGLLRPTQVPGKYKNYLAQRYSSDLEAQAIIKRYARRQTGGALWLGVGTVAIATLASQTGTTTTSSGTSTFTISPLGYGILVGVFGGVGIGKLVRFSNQKLFEALSAHEEQLGLRNRAGGSLPAATRE